MLHRSLKFRKRNLRSCLREVPGRIEFTIEFEARTAKDVRQRMDDVIASRGEGLVLKHPDSEYILNGRNKDWIKVCDSILYQAYQLSHPGREGKTRVYGWCVIASLLGG